MVSSGEGIIGGRRLNTCPWCPLRTSSKVCRARIESTAHFYTSKIPHSHTFTLPRQNYLDPLFTDTSCSTGTTQRPLRPLAASHHVRLTSNDFRDLPDSDATTYWTWEISLMDDKNWTQITKAGRQICNLRSCWQMSGQQPSRRGARAAAYCFQAP